LNSHPLAAKKTLSDFAMHGCLMGEMHEKSDAQLLREYSGAEPKPRSAKSSSGTRI
jgi:hypothetical protein